MFPASEQRQAEMVRTLNEKNVNWAIVADNTLDNREDRRFFSHPQISLELPDEEF